MPGRPLRCQIHEGNAIAQNRRGPEVATHALNDFQGQSATVRAAPRIVTSVGLRREKKIRKTQLPAENFHAVESALVYRPISRSAVALHDGAEEQGGGAVRGSERLRVIEFRCRKGQRMVGRRTEVPQLQYGFRIGSVQSIGKHAQGRGVRV